MAKQVQKPVNMDARFVAGTTVTLENVEIKHAHTQSPDTEYGNEWSIHCKISQATADKMRDLGFNVKEDSGDGSYWIKGKRVVTTRAGKSMEAPVFKDTDGNPITTELGNGSICDVDFWCKYTAPIQGKIYMGTYLNGGTVKTLVPKSAQTSEVIF